MSEDRVQLRQKGVITLPVGLRRKYDLREGDMFSVIDLGEGSFVLSTKPSALARLGDEVASILREDGGTLETLLEALDQEREAYYRQHFAQEA